MDVITLKKLQSSSLFFVRKIKNNKKHNNKFLKDSIVNNVFYNDLYFSCESSNDINFIEKKININQKTTIFDNIIKNSIFNWFKT